MAHVLTLDDSSDLFTQYAYAFRRELIFDHFVDTWSQHSIHSISGNDFIQPDVDDYLRANEIDYLTGAGHGVDKTFKGFRNSTIWTSAKPPSMLQGSIVHLLSCRVGGALGKGMMKSGIRAFWGYSDRFKFYMEDPQPSDFTKDELARIFFEMDCIIDREILNGKPPSEVYAKVSSYVDDVYDQLENDEASRVFLLNNFDCLAKYGGEGSILT